MHITKAEFLNSLSSYYEQLTGLACITFDSSHCSHRSSRATGFF